MFKYCSLYSGSSGNSFFVKSDSTNLLIDAGVSLKKLTTALSELNVDSSQINAILVTHEHIDHTRSLASFSNKYNIPVFATKKTWEAMPDIFNKILDSNKKYFNIEEEFLIGDIKIFPFHIPHDAADPCGFNLFNNDKKISIATDIGNVTNDLFNHLKHSSSVLLEANYDLEILKCSSYPYLLKQRISSDIGHLSNNSAAHTLSLLYNHGLKKALLIHLSKENNFPELVYETMKNELSNCKNISINVAPRDKPSELFDVS